MATSHPQEDPAGSLRGFNPKPYINKTSLGYTATMKIEFTVNGMGMRGDIL